MTARGLSLCCLHGSLQSPAVWKALPGDLAAGCRTPDLLAIPTATATGYWSWVRGFQAQSPSDRREVLLGYSLGGRLALHALLAAPQRWAGAIVVAAHPGLADPAARARRRAGDRAWARRFAGEPLEAAIAAWDRQAVFQGIPCPVPRQFDAASRARAIASCTRFSLGCQTNLQPQLLGLGSPVLYVTGAADEKYCRIGAQLAATCSTTAHAIVPAAAHRVPWENPAGFAAVVRLFLATLAP